MVVSSFAREDLHFPGETAKRSAVNDSISIPLEGPAISMLRFRVFSPS